MFSRLILVGMVAALGITVPTRLEILAWMHSAHSWTASQLAAWDARECSEVEEVVARVSLPPSHRMFRPFEPIVVEDRPTGLAHQLNRDAEGLEVHGVPAITIREAASEVTGLPPTVRPSRDSGLDFSADTVEQKLAVLLFRAAEGRDIPPIIERRSSVAIPPMSCQFSAGATAGRPARQAMAAPIERVSPPMVESSHQAIEPLDVAGPGIAEELNRIAEGIDPAGQIDSVTVASGRWVLATIDPGTTPESGMADELNRRSDGLATSPSVFVVEVPRKPEQLAPKGPNPPGPDEGRVTTCPQPPPDVGLALRLTREAAHAWMNVLNAPAAVRMSAR